MHVNPAFRDDDQAHALMLAQNRCFGVLSVNGPDGPLVSHLPFIAEPTRVALHLTRSNPIARLIRKEGAQQAVLAVSGPDGYISPDWYGVDDQVPTWNYIAVHLRGTLDLLPDDHLRPHLDYLSEVMESRLAPKKPWHSSKMTEDAMERMMRMIVPAEMTIRQSEGTWKLNQNKDDAAREGAIRGLGTSDIGMGLDALADAMRNWERQ